MTTETLIFILTAAASNVIALVGSYVSISTRLTRIETNLKWIAKNCPKCQLNSDNLLR